MTFSVQSSLRNMGDSVYYEDGWLLTIESHLPLLRSSTYSSITLIDPHDAYKFEGDFGGLLLAYQLPAQYQFVYLRANGLYAPYEYPSTMTQLITPSADFLNRLRRTYQTVSQKTNGT